MTIIEPTSAAAILASQPSPLLGSPLAWTTQAEEFRSDVGISGLVMKRGHKGPANAYLGFLMLLLTGASLTCDFSEPMEDALLCLQPARDGTRILRYGVTMTGLGRESPQVLEPLLWRGRWYELTVPLPPYAVCSRRHGEHALDDRPGKRKAGRG